MSWRPKDWEDIISDQINMMAAHPYRRSGRECFEAGANKMLVAAKKAICKACKKQMGITECFIDDQCWIIKAISEKEENNV